MNKKKFYVPLIAAMTVFFVMALGAVAIADTLVADADVVTVGDQASLALGTVSPGEVITKDVGFQLVCAGKAHVDSGQIVTLTFTLAGSTVPAGGSLTAGSASIGGIPTAWPDDTAGGGSTNCPSPTPVLDDNGNSTVTITAPTTPGGPYTYVAKFSDSYSPSQSDDPNDITGSDPTATFTLSVSTPSDEDPPVIAAHADVTAEATSPAGAIVSYTSPATSDNVDPDGDATCFPASGTQFALGNTTVTCNASDAAGNDATPTTFVIHVVDTTAPVIASHGDETAEATSAGGATVSYTSPATSDAVDGAGTATCAPASGSSFALGNTTVTCDASDAAENDAASTTFVVHVVDTTAPSVIAPSDMDVEATGASGAIVTFTASASDIVDGTVAVTCDPASGSTFDFGTTEVECSATDAHGNEGTATFNVTVADTTDPVLALPADLTAEATSGSGAEVTFTASATDIVDGTVDVICTPPSGSTFPLGTTTVICSAEDSSGNEATGSFVVTVEDTTPPALTLPADQTLEATGHDGAVATFSPSPSASDLVDGSLAVTCDWESGDTFSLGTTTVSCSAEDSSGNEATDSFDVTVVDTTPPVIASHGDETAEATSAAGADVSYTSPTTSDAVDGAGTATCAPASGSTFALGDTTVTCNATDAAGNDAASTTFVVHVVDTTPPVIASHGDETAEATSAAGADVSYTSPTTSDAVDGAGTATCAPASDSTFALGDTTVTCNATDAAGNAATPTAFTVHVVDTTAPVIASHLDVTAEATSAAGAIVNYDSPATSDAVDGAGTATCAPVSGTQFALGNTTVTCNSADAAGNAADPTTFVVHVVDTTAPIIASAADITVNAASSSGAAVTYTSPATSDAVDGAGTATCSPASGSAFPVGTTIVTCNAVDAAGNHATPKTFKVNVLYNWNGFFQPVDNSMWNSAKAGQSIPVKFSLGGNMGLDIFGTWGSPAKSYPKITAIACPSASISIDAIEEYATSTANNGLVYDATAGQYNYVWKTEKSWATKCFQFDLGLKDGSIHTFKVQFSK